MQVKKHIVGLSPRILLEPHSIWMGESNHKKPIHFLARLIIKPGAQKLNKNNQPYFVPSSNCEKASDKHRKRLCIQSQIQNKTSSHHPRSQKTPILSSSRQWISQGKFIRTKQEGSQLHQARAISISWSPIIMTPTQSMQNR